MTDMTNRCSFQALGVRCCLKPHGDEAQHQALISDVLAAARDPKTAAQQHLELRAATRCPVGAYAHHKGGIYIVFAHSVDESTLQPLVHYYSLERSTRWTRTVENFVEVVGDEPRFRRRRDATEEELRVARSGGPT